MRAVRGLALALGALLALTARSALALDGDEARNKAEFAIRAAEADAAKAPDPSRLRTPPPTPAQRVAAGDMLLRTGDYDAAVDQLSKVLELRRQGQMPENAYADASFLIGEAYFQSSQYISARRHYR